MKIFLLTVNILLAELCFAQKNSPILNPWNIKHSNNNKASSSGSNDTYGTPIFTQEGTVSGNFTITFTATGKVLKNRDAFTLRDLGIQYANYSTDNSSSLYYLRSNCGGVLNSYADARVKSYDVEIYNPDMQKTFYGKIAFFVSKPEAATQAVARSYYISITPETFDKGTNGRTADVYESYDLHGSDYVTWVIFLPCGRI